VLRNDGAKDGDLLFLTKPIGVGIITTAIKKGVAVDGDLEKAIDAMTTLNKIGSEIGKINGVIAVTDVTGFGLFGHLLEMLQADTLMAELEFAAVPLVTNLRSYLDTYTIPAITYRNWNSYGHLIRETSADALHICCDPQTSGGLLIAIAPESVSELLHLMQAFKVSGNCLQPIGKIKLRTGEKQIEVHETISA
jgi:selenide,water dikinase